MVKIVQSGDTQPTSQVTCKGCRAVLEVGEREWRDGDYGSERHVSCPSCGSTIVKPGTEYRGDF